MEFHNNGTRCQLIAPCARTHTHLYIWWYAHTHQVIRHCSPIVILNLPFLCYSCTVRIVAFEPAMKRIASILYHYLLLNMLQSHWMIECVVHSHHSYHLVIQTVGPAWKQRIMITIPNESSHELARETWGVLNTYFVIGFWGFVVCGARGNASKIVVLLGIRLWWFECGNTLWPRSSTILFTTDD